MTKKREKEIKIHINQDSSESEAESKLDENTLVDDQFYQAETQNEDIEVQEDTQKIENNSISSDVIEKPAGEEAIDFKDQLFRVKAEFVNYRNRVTKEFEQIRKYTKAEFIKLLLPIIDNFENALEHSKNTNVETGEVVSGFNLIYQQLKDTLEKEGIEVLTPIGEIFDPKYYEAISVIVSDEFEDGQIIEVTQKGYIYEKILLRPAKVIVAKNEKQE